MRIQVARTAALAVRRGHPWVYREGVARPPKAAVAGTVVDLADDEGNALGWGMWDPASPIAVRVFAATGRSPERASDAIGARLTRAIARRDGWFGDETTAYRLCNGEGDRAPGFVLDRYGDAAIVRLDTDAWTPHLDAAIRAISGPLSERGVRTIALRLGEPGPDGKKIRVVHGREPPDRLFVREHGVAMEVDLSHGQKTGAFLDQRENRARVRALAAQVTSVDIASAAHASAQRTFRENDVDPTKHVFVSADAFLFLEGAKKRGERFDLIISDPPSFAPSERAKPKAESAYRKLHAACAAVLAEGGVYCAASCSSHIAMEEFVAMLDDGTLGRADLMVRELRGQPQDHASVPAWWEGRYLKFVVMG